MRAENWPVRWGRSAGARCETRRRRTLALCARQVGCRTDMCSPPQPATQGTTARVSLPLQMPIYVRLCVHMWVPTAHCPPDHIAERAVESMLPATATWRTHPRSPPSPRRTHAHARSHARGSHTAHCANETDVATQGMSTCRSQCDGDRIHPVWGGRDLLRLFGRILLGHRLLGLPNQNEAAELQSPARANPHPDFGGPKRSENLPSRSWAR